MKLLKKKIIIISLIFTSIIIIVFGILFPMPKEFNRTFNDAFVTTDLKTKTGTSTIEIHAKLYKRYSFKHLNSEKILDGDIIIDNKKYSLIGYNLGKTTNNVLFGDIRETSTSPKSTYILYMMDDLSSMYLFSYYGKQRIAAPAKTINDFQSLRNKADGKSN